MVGSAITIVSFVRKHGEGSRASEPDSSAVGDAPSDDGTNDIADQLKKLADLRDQGILTGDEFESEKKKLLGR